MPSVEEELAARLVRGEKVMLATVIRREREGCKDCILLNAGDVAQGSPVSTIFHGLPVFEVANLFGYDAGTLGNHDFDYPLCALLCAAAEILRLGVYERCGEMICRILPQ